MSTLDERSVEIGMCIRFEALGNDRIDGYPLLHSKNNLREFQEKTIHKFARPLRTSSSVNERIGPTLSKPPCLSTSTQLSPAIRAIALTHVEERYMLHFRQREISEHPISGIEINTTIIADPEAKPLADSETYTYLNQK